MPEFPCPHCHKLLATKQSLQSHLHKKNPCTVGDFACSGCRAKFLHRNNRDHHQKHDCKGRSSTYADKDKNIEKLKTVLAATSSLGEIKQLTDTVIQVNGDVGTLVTGDQINHVQNTIIVLPNGSENIGYIRDMALEQLKEHIGLTHDPLTMAKLFNLIRANEAHPENHTMLLPDRDGETIHYKDSEGWKERPFEERVRRMIHADHELLQSLVRKDWDNYEKFYWDYLVFDIGRKCAELDHTGLKPIYDEIRNSIHELTVNLASKTVAIEAEDTEGSDTIPIDDVDREMQLLEIQEIDLQLKKIELKKALLGARRCNVQTTN